MLSNYHEFVATTSEHDNFRFDKNLLDVINYLSTRVFSENNRMFTDLGITSGMRRKILIARLNVHNMIKTVTNTVTNINPKKLEKFRENARISILTPKGVILAMLMSKTNRAAILSRYYSSFDKELNDLGYINESSIYDDLAKVAYALVLLGFSDHIDRMAYALRSLLGRQYKKEFMTMREDDFSKINHEKLGPWYDKSIVYMETIDPILDGVLSKAKNEWISQHNSSKSVMFFGNDYLRFSKSVPAFASAMAKIIIENKINRKNVVSVELRSK